MSTAIWRRLLAPSLRSRWDKIGQKPGGSAAPTLKDYDTKGVFHWADHKQKVFGHEPDGVRFYHYVQSFRIGEEITPHEAHDIGMEFAKSFGNREVLVATHIDREHIHNHLVVCAYDLESGIKLHTVYPP